MKLTEGMRRMLRTAIRVESGGFDGACAYGAGQQASIRACVSRGLLSCVGIGAREDDSAEVPIYQITDAGRAALADTTGERGP